MSPSSSTRSTFIRVPITIKPPCFLRVLRALCGELARLFDEQLGDLHRVRRGALAQVVAHTPERKAVVARQVLADAADESPVVVPIASACGIGYSPAARSSTTASAPASRRTTRAPRSTVIFRSVSTKMLSLWQLLTGARTHVGQTLIDSSLEDFLGLVDHLHLLGGVALVLLASRSAGSG